MGVSPSEAHRREVRAGRVGLLGIGLCEFLLRVLAMSPIPHRLILHFKFWIEPNRAAELMCVDEQVYRSYAEAMANTEVRLRHVTPTVFEMVTKLSHGGDNKSISGYSTIQKLENGEWINADA